MDRDGDHWTPFERGRGPIHIDSCWRSATKHHVAALTRFLVKRRSVLLPLAAIFIGAIAIISLRPGEREPEYQGKKLSEWLLAYHHPWESVDPSSTRAAEAVRTIGTNAVPCLVKWTS